jgi:putative aldouronate transport system permease protein
VFVTIVGTIIGVMLTTTMGYVLSRRGYKLNGFLTWLVFIPMIFNGGMIASYVVNTNLLGLKDSIWALILPLEVSSFSVIICKTFFRTTIPDSIIESAKIDGAAQLGIYSKIVLPISKPVLATIALFLCFGYWNDWFQSSLYISNTKLLSLQALLNSIQKNIQFLANNPSAGLTLQQYKNQMPTESARMAMAIVIIIPIACAYPYFQKYFISGLTIGAVKG